MGSEILACGWEDVHGPVITDSLDSHGGGQLKQTEFCFFRDQN